MVENRVRVGEESGLCSACTNRSAQMRLEGARARVSLDKAVQPNSPEVDPERQLLYSRVL